MNAAGRRNGRAGARVVLAVAVMIGGSAMATGMPRGMMSGRGTQHRGLQHVMGFAKEVGGDYFVVKPAAGMGAMGGGMPAQPVKIWVDRSSHLFRLDPAKLLVARPGWAAHAIGVEHHGVIHTKTLVLFPPSSAAGVPPEGQGISGIGTLVGIHPLILKRRSGAHQRLVMDPGAAVRIALPMSLSALREGERVMTFYRQEPRGDVAVIVHIPIGMSSGAR